MAAPVVVPKSVWSALEGVLSPSAMSIPLPLRLISLATPSRMDTSSESKFAVAKSCTPSPLKSPIAKEIGLSPTPRVVVPLKPPSPSPRRMDTLSEK